MAAVAILEFLGIEHEEEVHRKLEQRIRKQQIRDTSDPYYMMSPSTFQRYYR